MKSVSPLTAAGIAAAIAAVLALAGCSTAGNDSASLNPSATVAPLAAAEPTTANWITTVGTGRVSGTPDVMSISLGVETRAASANEALEQNNSIAADVIAVLKASGVAPADLQTSRLSVYPTYEDNNQITGYQVTNVVTATLRDITAAGTVIDAVAEKAGDAVRVHQLSFSTEDDSALRAAARAEAVQQAQAQAQQLADAAGVQLGSIRSITESPLDTPSPYYPAMADAAAASSVPLEVGSQELSIEVQVVYEILS